MEKEKFTLFVCGKPPLETVKLKVEVPKELFEKYKSRMGDMTTDELFIEFMRNRIDTTSPPPLGAA